jgi:ABC-type lipoprotein export system ATPase subunit
MFYLATSGATSPSQVADAFGFVFQQFNLIPTLTAASV